MYPYESPFSALVFSSFNSQVSSTKSLEDIFLIYLVPDSRRFKIQFRQTNKTTHAVTSAIPLKCFPLNIQIAGRIAENYRITCLHTRKSKSSS